MVTLGLDWDKIREDYRAKASPSELVAIRRNKDGSEVPVYDEATTPPARRQRPARSGHEYGDGSASTIPRSRVIDLYSQNWTAREIADHFGCAVSGIYKHLHAAAERGQVTLRDDRKNLSGRPRREVCGKGEHPMTEGHENVRIDSNGSRHCRTCERARAARRSQNTAQAS